MLLMVLVACSNLTDRAFNPEGGSRHATGEWNGWEGDTAGDTGGGGGGDTDIGEVTDDSPVIDGVTTVWVEGDDGTRVDVSVSYSDPQDDLPGGKVYFAYATGDEAATNDNREIVEEASWDSTDTQAGYTGTGVIELQLGPVDGTKSFALTEVLLRDDAGNSSEAMDAPLLEPEQ